MTFIPDFDLTKYQWQSSVHDGKYHVRVLNSETMNLEGEHIFEDEASARAKSIEVRDVDGKIAVLFTPTGKVIGTYWIDNRPLEKFGATLQPPR